MANFEYIKWVTENKYGKSPNYGGSSGQLNEQISGSNTTCYRCSGSWSFGNESGWEISFENGEWITAIASDLKYNQYVANRYESQGIDDYCGSGIWPQSAGHFFASQESFISLSAYFEPY